PTQSAALPRRSHLTSSHRRISHPNDRFQQQQQQSNLQFAVNNTQQSLHPDQHSTIAFIANCSSRPPCHSLVVPWQGSDSNGRRRWWWWGQRGRREQSRVLHARRLGCLQRAVGHHAALPRHPQLVPHRGAQAQRRGGWVHDRILPGRPPASRQSAGAR
ncbi:unnamed protein product, partial [Laminaria digitata]